MKIWSIQNIKAWEVLKRKGRLTAKPYHQADCWPHAYDWMREQLVDRIGSPPTENSAPLWGWYQWSNINNKRPDLRSLRHYWGPAGQHVMIEYEIPDNEVLLSDQGAWNNTIHNSYLALNDAEDDQFNERLKQSGWQIDQPIPDHLLSEIHKSWERIFDLEALDGEFWGAVQDKSIQASFWEIRMDQVLSNKLFTSKTTKII